MKEYKKPNIDIIKFEGENIMNTSSVGLTSRFVPIDENNKTNSIQLDSLHS